MGSVDNFLRFSFRIDDAAATPQRMKKWKHCVFILMWVTFEYLLCLGIWWLLQNKVLDFEFRLQSGFVEMTAIAVQPRRPRASHSQFQNVKLFSFWLAGWLTGWHRVLSSSMRWGASVHTVRAANVVGYSRDCERRPGQTGVASCMIDEYRSE